MRYRALATVDYDFGDDVVAVSPKAAVEKFRKCLLATVDYSDFIVSGCDSVKYSVRKKSQFVYRVDCNQRFRFSIPVKNPEDSGMEIVEERFHNPNMKRILEKSSLERLEVDKADCRVIPFRR